MLDRLKSFFASGLFLAVSGLGGALMLTWPLMSIPAQGTQSSMVTYIYCVWAGLIFVAALWGICQPPEEETPPAIPSSAPTEPPDTTSGQAP